MSREGAAAVDDGPPRARVAVLLSGRGSNFLALYAAMERGELPAEIVLVVSNVEEAGGLAKARDLRLPTLAVPNQRFTSRLEQEREILRALEKAGAEWVCLAGYMRRLTGQFVGQYPQRILNIHPSLLPAFPGLDAQRQAVEHGVKLSGCTVHLVDEGVDSGPIVVQRAVPVRDDDLPETLAARILSQEHQAYTDALRRLLTEPWRVDGRRLRFAGEPPEMLLTDCPATT